MAQFKRIFTNTNIFHLSDPQPTWMFEVNFFNANDPSHSTFLQRIIKENLVPTSVTLPSYKTETITKKWFGSEKSFPVIRTYGGDCTMNFDVRSHPCDNEMLYRLAQLNTLIRNESERPKGVSKDAKKANVKTEFTTRNDYIMFHPELENLHNFDKIEGQLGLVALKFHKIHVKLKNKTVPVEEDSPSTSTIYEYNNCIITEFGFNEDLDYSSESKLTCKITFHYDMWHVLAYPYDTTPPPPKK